MELRASRISRWLALAGCAVALGMAVPGVTDAQDVGYPQLATHTLTEGTRTLHLEQVSGKAVVKRQAGIAGGQDVLGQAVPQARSADGAVIILADANSAVAKDASAHGLSVADYLVGQEDVAFAGPVFKLGDRELGTSNRLLVQFSPDLSAASQAAILAKHGLEAISDDGQGFWVASLATRDGNATLAKAEALQAESGIVAAGVDWYVQYTNTNVTPRFGGTSSAAPVVSGIAALVLSINPNLTQAEVRQLIKDSALPFQGNDPRRNEMGTGIVNAERAVRLAILGTNGVVVDPTPADFIPLNDPLIPFQWHLNADAIGEATASSDINLAEAFAVMNANGFFPIPANRMVKVGVIDDGIASDHDDLNVVAGYDAPGDPRLLDPAAAAPPKNASQAQPRSAGTHGTAVAGVIAGRSNNSVAGIGVAPGMPIVGVRLIQAPDLNPLLFSVAVKNAFDFAVAEGAKVINNSWGVYTGTDPCNAGDDNVVVPGTLGELQGLANALNNNVVVVFAAGNERAKVDGFEINGSPNVLTVGATNNLGRSSSYSNYGAAIDVAAPSNDFPICAPGDPFYTGGTLGIVTTSMDYMALGGNNGRFDAFDELSYGGANTISIADWNALLLNHYFRLASRTITRTGTSVTREEIYESTAGRGIIFQIQAGQVELMPGPTGIFSDDLGNLTGTVQIRVRAATGVVTQDFVVPITAGRTRSLRRGVVDVSEFYSTLVMLTGRAVIAGQNVTFRVTGSERFAVVEGELHERTDTVTSIGGTIPAFRVHSLVAIQGAGTHRTEGLFVRTLPATTATGNIRIPVPLAEATMYTVAAVPTPPTRPNRLVGAASVDYTLGAELAGDLAAALPRPLPSRSVTTARFSRPGTFGTAQASLVAGRWRGMSQGFHTADVNQASIDLANLTFFPSTIVVSSPFGVNSVRSLDRPPVVR